MGMVIGVESLGETLGSAMFKGLLDEHTQDLRSKRTVQYMLEHQTKMNWNILHYAKRYANGNIEVDALFNEAIIYFCDHNDYDINIAIERCREDKEPASLEAYVNKCVECVVKSYYSKLKRYYDRNVPSEIKRDDDTYDSTIDKYYHTEDAVDNPYIFEDLEEVLSDLESKRYTLGYDVYTQIYLGLSLDRHGLSNISKEKKDQIWRAAQVYHNENARETVEQSEIKSRIAGALSKCMSTADESGEIDGYDAALKVIRKYVYGPDRIDGIISLVLNERESK